MDFVFKSENIIKTVKRQFTVCIAGLTIGIAAIAASGAPDLSGMKIPVPLERTIARAVPSEKAPELGFFKLGTDGERKFLLESSLEKNGKSDMGNEASALWNEMLPDIIEIPFNKVFAQYDNVSESFFFAYNFKSGQRLEATTYVDSEDDNVYFSVISEGKVFFQNVLSRTAFFEKAKSTWTQFEENIEVI